MDDLITGFDNVVQAKDICTQISKILQSGCFNLRKWSSNCREVVNLFQDKSDPLSVLNFDHSESTKTLGIQWSSSADILLHQIAIKSLDSNYITKRIVLSNIARIFDPLGLISPCVITLKILLQDIWAEGVDWDTELSVTLYKTWTRFAENAKVFHFLEVPRYVLSPNTSNVELHGFCDASQRAYAAAIYLRSVDNNNILKVALLCAKTKVAPIKKLTIPRLELCGVLLLARLSTTVIQSLNLKNIHCSFWCDSQIVLHWLHTPLPNLDVFVRNRISIIKNLTDVNQWQYVPTKENPADCATRRVFPNEIVSLDIWWNGPLYLRGHAEWPEKMTFSCKTDPSDVHKTLSLNVVNEVNLNLFDRHCNLQKLVRVVSYCLRFSKNCKCPKSKRMFGPLVPKEIDRGMNVLVKLSQIEYFNDEITLLSTNKGLKPKHRLLALAPFVDSDGVLRVGGRLAKSHYSYSKKHPALLNGRHKLSELILKDEHFRLQHAGPQLLLNSVRETYWPTNGMNVAKSIIRNCATCFKARPRTITHGRLDRK